MSDSSDLEWSDDDSILEQRKQQLLQQQKDNAPSAHPAFVAQFDPKSPTYHGNYDPRPLNIPNTGAKALPKELQQQYGLTSITSLDQITDEHNTNAQNTEAFNTDPEAFGPVYYELFKTREHSISLKKHFNRLQNLFQEYLRVVETHSVKRASRPATPDREEFANLPKNVSEEQMTKKTTLARENLLSTMIAVTRAIVLYKAALTNPALISIITRNDFAISQHIDDINAILTTIGNITAGRVDHDRILATEEAMYYQMKQISTDMTTQQSKMLQRLKQCKKEFVDAKKKE